MPAVLDLMIEGALVLDGTGDPAYAADVGVDAGAIVSIDRNAPRGRVAARTVPASGRALAPGFVDVHTHSDLCPLVDADMASSLRQGVTTAIVGNCGSSPWPIAGFAGCAQMAGAGADVLAPTLGSFGDYLDRIQAAAPAVNVAALVGHGAIRAEVMGSARRPPTGQELDRMRGLVAAAMNDGALGLSTGLIYVPGMHAATGEVVSLAAVAGRARGLYASHIRGEGAHLFRAVDEAIEIGRRAEIPAHVSHLKCETSFVWGRAPELLERIHGARDVSADQYPYTAWASVLWSLLPAWAPVNELEELLTDGSTRERLIGAVEGGEGDAFQSSVAGVGWDRIVIEATADGSCNGLSIAAVADRRGMAPVDACFALLIEDPETACIGDAMDEADVRTILSDPDVMVASDASAMRPDGPLGTLPVHPRTYGTFPRVLGRYVRDGTVTIEQAVRKMTSLPADRFGLAGRGRIAEGAVADLVLFAPELIADTAVFGAPHRYPAGIDLVVVNGSIAWEGGAIARHGQVLRRSQI